MLLQTMESWLGADAAAAGVAPQELLVGRYWVAMGRGVMPANSVQPVPPLPDGSSDVPANTVAVVANHNRWVARCVFCPGAEMASSDDPRFFCCSCGNAPAGGAWLPTVWPATADQIEQTLMLRPDPDTRNWEVGETVADLQAENQANGVPVPVNGVSV